MENKKWASACKSANEKVLITLKETEDLMNVVEWIRDDDEICRKLPKIYHVEEEDRFRGLDLINGEFKIHTKEAPVMEEKMDGLRAEQARIYSRACRISILHAIKLATKLETEPDPQQNDNYGNKVREAADAVMSAFKVTDNINAIKILLGISKSAKPVNAGTEE